jgi:hypothetical protein
MRQIYRKKLKNTQNHRYHKCGFETNIGTETYPNMPVQDLSTASPMLWKRGMDNKKRLRLTACDMKFMRRTAGYTKWNHKRNEDILLELKIQPMIDYIKHYQESWRSHDNRINAERFPKAIFRYRPKGKRSIGRPMKRWRENSRP